jgi:DNA polymerase-3 subunit delta'
MTFENIIGQKNLVAHLARNVEARRTPHAQLFVGKNGYGNLALAMAYAQHLVAFEAPSKEKVKALNHPDIHFYYPIVKKGSGTTTRTSKDYLSEWRAFLEGSKYGNLNDWYAHIDAGNKQGAIAVDEAHDIIKTLSLKAYSGGHKVLIMWHAEMMNSACANKLLKWIEEPNTNTSILLLTESANSLLKTIQSRCQTVHVMPLSPKDIYEALVEKGVDPSKAKQISETSEGDYGKALALSDEDKNSLAFEQLFIEWVRTAFKAKTDKKSINQLMAWSERVAKLGRELEKQFLHYSLNAFRQAMLLNYGANEMVSLKIRDTSFSLKKFSLFVGSANIEGISREFENAIYHIERNGNGKIILTDLSIKLTRLLHKKE